MSYYEEYTIAGKTVEVTKKYPSKRKNITRNKKSNKTCEEQKVVNRNRAIKKLRLLLNNNFEDNVDAHIVLTYKKENRPQTAEQSRSVLDKFMRDLRKLYKKAGKILKYITVTEYKRATIHHHIVINDFNAREIKEAWVHGKINITPLYTNGQYEALAEYLVKETNNTFDSADAIYRKRWNPSKNLKQPLVIRKKVNAMTWRKQPKAKKGYYIEKDSIYNGINPFTGCEYQFYRMIKLD